MSAIPAAIDPVVLLQELGVMVQDIRGDEVWARCPGHIKRVGHIDHDASWSMNVDSGEHHCFSCGYGGTLSGLIAIHHEWTDDKGMLDIKRAERWLFKRGGESLDLAGKLLTTAQAFVKPSKRKAMDESRLALFVDPPEVQMHSRGVSAESVALYGVRWDTEYEAWVLPIRDPQTHKLWGWQLKNDVVFRNKPSGVRKSETLFGWDIPQKHRVAFVIESPLDCLRVRTVGLPADAYSTYGASWSEAQMQLLASRYEEVVFAFDNPAIDDAGRRAALKVMGRDGKGKRIPGGKDWTTQFTRASFFSYLTNDKDPGDMNATDILHSYQHSMSSVHGAAAVIQ